MSIDHRRQLSFGGCAAGPGLPAPKSFSLASMRLNPGWLVMIIYPCGAWSALHQKAIKRTPHPCARARLCRSPSMHASNLTSDPCAQCCGAARAAGLAPPAHHTPPGVVAARFDLRHASHHIISTASATAMAGRGLCCHCLVAELFGHHFWLGGVRVPLLSCHSQHVVPLYFIFQ